MRPSGLVAVVVPSGFKRSAQPQRVAPECRIVYVDNDPLVLAHARALLTSSREGTAAYIDADVHDPGAILAEAAKTLDFTNPIAVIMNGIRATSPTTTRHARLSPGWWTACRRAAI